MRKYRISRLFLRRAAIGLLLVWSFREWVCRPVRIDGQSMEPTLHDGQLAGVDELAFVRNPPRRGDIIAVRAERELIIKRIVGLPGEEVSLCQGTFLIGGRLLCEPYVQVQSLDSISAGKIEPNHFVIAGDNRSETFIGVVDRNRILGRVIIWHSQTYNKSNSQLTYEDSRQDGRVHID